MRILFLELRGFKRMALNQVELFSIRPSEAMQLILGTNGSGKSSLIGELTPLPPNAADYLKDGSKTIKLTHRGNTYVLKSDFASSHKHSFSKNDEELNEGGTVTVQKELVRQEFGITPEIHELLTGQELFCRMSPTRRREWFTKLCDTNYDYAILVFKRLQTRARDISGALKLEKKRLVAEQAKVISEAEEQKLRREVQEISAELDVLQAERAPVERPSAQHRADIDAGFQELNILSQRLLRMRFVPPFTQPLYMGPAATDVLTFTYERKVNSMEDLGDAIDVCRHEISVSEELINKAVAEHQKIQETVGALERTGAQGLQVLQQRRDRLRAQLLQELSGRHLQIDAGERDPQQLLNALDSVMEALVSVFSTLSDNEDRRYSQQRLQELSAQLLAAKDLRAKKVNEISYLGAQRQQLEAHKSNHELQCPSCSHRWYHGYSEEAHRKLLELIAEQEDKLREAERRVTDLEHDIQTVREYAELYRSYVRTTQAFSLLQPLWGYLQESGLVARSPRLIPPLLTSYREDLLADLVAQRTRAEIQAVERLMVDAEAAGDANLSEQRVKLEESSLRIDELTARLRRAQRSLAEYQQFRKQLLEGQELAQRIARVQENLGRAASVLTETLRREAILQCISQLRHILVRKEEVLAAVVLQKGIIRDIEANIARLQVQEQAADLLEKELSPTDGLIAEGLLGFIRTFNAQMNSLIRKIWAYPLVIKDCGISGDGATELDYKFPLMVQAKDNVVPDISKGSDGMQEIVNLAFKVTAMQHLGLAESPLILDEFGRSMDSQHRVDAVALVKSLMETKHFTQMFMVNHYSSEYGAFTNAQICVLDARNITVPHKYNEHVVIA